MLVLILCSLRGEKRWTIKLGRVLDADRCFASSCASGTGQKDTEYGLLSANCQEGRMNRGCTYRAVQLMGTTSSEGCHHNDGRIRGYTFVCNTYVVYDKCDNTITLMNIITHLLSRSSLRKVKHIDKITRITILR